MKRLILIVGLTLLFCSLYAQQLRLSDIPTPQASTLGKYGDIPMSYYTGRANITIPLFSFTVRNVTFPIFLSYDCSGVQPNSLPGWTGHNWTISAGGAITRVVQGRYDEYIYPKGAHISTKGYNYFQSCGAINRLMNNHTALLDSVYHGVVDLAPDLFYFNFLGITGRFFLGNDGEWKVDCEQNIDVVFDYRDENNYMEPFISKFPYIYAADHQPKTIKGFMLRDENGTKYYFGGNTNSIEYRTDFFRMKSTEEEGSWIANSWYLTKIEDRHGNILYTLQYSRSDFMVQLAHSASATSVDNQQYWFWGSYGDSYSFSNFNFPYVIEVNAPIFLDAISMADGREVSFGYTVVRNMSHKFYKSYYDRGMASVLESMRPVTQGLWYYYLQTDDEAISQYQANPGSNKRLTDPLSASGMYLMNAIHLNYPRNGYYTHNYVFNYDMGDFPMLTSVQIIGSNIYYNWGHASIGEYTLKYDQLDHMAYDHLTTAVDHWGYYNGNPYRLNVGSPVVFSSFSTTRNPNPEYAKRGLLKEIVYPTGGACVFEYEANDFSQCMSLDRQSVRDSIGIAGGMRIKSITEYEDSTHAVVLSQRSFRYKNPNTNLSSGQLFAPPIYYWQNWMPVDAYGGHSIHQSYFRTTAILPLSNSFGPHIGYSYVEETLSDGTRNIYHYTNIADKKDGRFVLDFNNGTLSPFDKFSERGYARGKLLKREIFDADGNMVKEETYTYRTDDVEEEFVLSANLEFENNGSSGSFAHYNGGIYKLFFPKYDVIRKEVKTIYPQGCITERTDYHKSDVVLPITTSNYQRSVKIRKLNSETLRRGCDSLVTLYTYPHEMQDSTHKSMALQQWNISMVPNQKQQYNILNIQIQDNWQNTKNRVSRLHHLSGGMVITCFWKKQRVTA